MNLNKRFPKKTFIALVIAFSIFGCKNGGKEDNFGWFSDEVENPTTSEEVMAMAEELSKENLLYQEEKVDSFYQSRDFVPAWNNSEARSAAFNALKNASEEGLFLEDYHGQNLKDLLKNAENLEEKNRAKLEILLTDALLEYAEDLYYGKLDPNEMYSIWGVEKEPVNVLPIVENAVSDGNINQALSSLKPTSPVYSGLKESLETYKTLKQKEVPFEKIGPGEAIKPGEKDERIPLIVERLKQLGILNEDFTSEENVYNETLQEAIKKFQKEKGLATDIILGNSTISELNMGAEQRYNQILANLERWRWYPRDLGEHYILINIPAYRLVVVKNGDTVRTHNVIAGAKHSQTPVFSDSIQYIVINPEWHIPASIINNEIIPLASGNPNYLESRNIYVTGPEGNRIAPSEIDWTGDAVKSYRFTQGAGPSNSLGRIKIIYPNKHAIYLHDTPAKAVFSQNARAESHGCVRVENAIALAAYVVSDQEEWDLDRIEDVIAKSETKQVAVTQPIKVHHFYWTAWNNHGETIFTNDIYGLDKEIYTALKK